MKKPKFGYVLLFFIFISITYMSFKQNLPKSLGEDWILTSGVLSIVIFWFWMITNFICNRKKLKHPIVWGLFLLFGNWAAAAIYFIAKYNDPNGKCNYSRLHEWFFHCENKIQFYGKVAVICFIVTIVHHHLMKNLYMVFSIQNYAAYQVLTDIIYFPFFLFMKGVFSLLLISPGGPTETPFLFVRIMRFVYTYILFYCLMLFALNLDKRRVINAN
ncbi:MAG: hypothetical protein WC539_08750 [Nitrospirota bacterium]